MNLLKKRNIIFATAVSIALLMALYVKRWYFRLLWHDALFTLTWCGDEYIGELVLLGVLSSAFLFMGIAFPFKSDSKVSRVFFICLAILMPAISCFVVELTLNSYVYMPKTLLLGICNVSLYYFIYLFLFLLTNSLRFTMMIGILSTSFFAIINSYVYVFRDKPVFPQDLYSLKTAGAVAGQYDWEINGYVLVTVVIAVSLCVFWSRYKRKSPDITRFFTLCFTVAIGLFIKIGILDRNICDVEMNMWAPIATCYSKGYSQTFLYSLKYVFPEKPDDYSKEEIGKATEKYSAVKENEKADLPSNIIVIMEESWADLSVLGDFSVSDEVMPFYDEMSGNVVKGKTYVSVFGGNTSNSEYEFLTGNSVGALPGEAVAYETCMRDKLPSVVSFFSDLGYGTVSYHPERKSNYSREKVYKYLGFDESYWDDSFDDNEYVRSLISDSCDFRHIREIYEQKSSDKLFIFNVTAQNHAGYGKAEMTDKIHLNGDYSSDTVDEYLTLERITDSAIQELIDYFSGVSEKTLILVFGDHQPTLESNFYSAIDFRENEDRYNNKFITNYFLWANYELPDEAVNSDIISVNFLPVLLMKAAGIERAGYAGFLEELYEEYPVISAKGCIGKDGKFSPYKEECEKTDLLKLYNSFQYNYIYDKRNMLDDFFWETGKN